MYDCSAGANWTWRQVMARLGEWCNWMVQEQCREIFSYLAYAPCGLGVQRDL